MRSDELPGPAGTIVVVIDWSRAAEPVARKPRREPRRQGVNFGVAGGVILRIDGPHIRRATRLERAAPERSIGRVPSAYPIVDDCFDRAGRGQLYEFAMQSTRLLRKGKRPPLWRVRTVRLRARSRRWFCDVPDCPREIFAKRFDGVLAHYARRTHETTDLLTTFARRA